jgi:hypothetical protein
MSNNRILGRVIPAREEARKAIATLSIRPQRIAFLIAEDFPFKELVQVIRYNTTIWGGIFNALVPTDRNALSEGWWRSLDVYDPDVVVACGSIGQNLVAEVKRRLQPLLVRDWQGLFIEEHRIDLLNNVRMFPILADVIETRAPDDVGSVICIPDMSPDHPFFRYAVPQLGVLDEVYQEIYTQEIHTPIVRFDESTDFVSYLDVLSSVLEQRYPIQLTQLRLSSTSHSCSMNGRITICLAGDDYVEDLCAFWTLRMSPTFGTAHTIFLPIESLESERNLKHLASWCNQRLVGTNFMVVASSSMRRQELQSFRSRLASLLRDEIDFIDLWVSHFTMGRYTVAHKEQRQELTWQGNHTRLKRPLPAFDNRYLSNVARWILDLDLADPLRRQQGFIPPSFPQLNHILNERLDKRWVKLNGYWMRKAHDVLSRRVNKKQSTEFIEIALPSEEDLFNELLATFSYQSKLTDKCRYVSGMTQLLENAGVVESLRTSLFRSLFERLAETKNAYDLNEIHGLVHCPNEQKEDFRNWLANLSRDGILLRGYRLRCPECNLEEWYPLGDVLETVTCVGCLTVFQLPFNAQFSYRLNRLVELGIEQGAIPVILTTMLLQNLSMKSLLHLPGIQAIQGNLEIDLDILASCDGHLVAVECKNLQGGCSEETAAKIAEQLKYVYEVSRDIGVEVVFLSMMTDEESPVLAELIDGMNQQDGPSVHLLLLDDLERGYPVKATDPEKAGEPKKVSLTDLLPKRPPGQGWIKESGRRQISF